VDGLRQIRISKMGLRKTHGPRPAPGGRGWVEVMCRS
jgi:hypothetical protein